MQFLKSVSLSWQIWLKMADVVTLKLLVIVETVIISVLKELN